MKLQKKGSPHKVTNPVKSAYFGRPLKYITILKLSQVSDEIDLFIKQLHLREGTSYYD